MTITLVSEAGVILETYEGTAIDRRAVLDAAFERGTFAVGPKLYRLSPPATATETAVTCRAAFVSYLED